MSFRRRLTLAGAAAVAIAVALASLATYFVVRAELRGQVDDSLRESAERLGGDVMFIHRLPVPDSAVEPHVPGVSERLVVPARPFGGPERYAQVVRPDGSVIRPPRGEDVQLPEEGRAREVAREGSGEFFSDGTVDGVAVRVLTRATPAGAALQIARPVEETESVLRRLRLVLAGVTLGGIALAGGLGLVVTRTALRPVAELSDTAEHVARTRDLSRRIQAEGSDELSRLAESFNTMLEALERSMRQQRQLVADASHELRTPLTSLRTNIEILATGNGLAPDERRRMLASITGQLEELSVLVADLVDLAREDEREEPSETVRLDELVEAAAERAKRRHPEREFSLALEETLVEGAPARIDRAVSNLLDNAQKWSPPGGRVEVALRDGELRVRDHGPGISPDDLPHIFDRFYRAPAARGTPGSGLGLAIARQVAESHGGSVSAETPADGGALVRLRLPASPASPDDEREARSPRPRSAGRTSRGGPSPPA